jgi:hypothetical protein
LRRKGEFEEEGRQVFDVLNLFCAGGDAEYSIIKFLLQPEPKVCDERDFTPS